MVLFEAPELPCDERSRLNLDLNLPLGSESDSETDDDQIVGGERYQFPKPIGYRFNPTDLELILAYLQRYVNGESLPQHKIHSVNVYEYHPSELADRFDKGNEKEFFFFTPRNRLMGERVARSAKGGFWHSNSATKKLSLGNVDVGEKQHLTFYSGKPPKEGKSNWLMVEYRLINPKKKDEKDSKQQRDSKMAIVLSKIYAKSEPEEEKTLEFADFIKNHQDYVTREEIYWHKLQSSQNRNRS